MPRKRQIDPGIWTSVQFTNIKELGARLLFIAMFGNADDEGRLKADPAYLKMTVFPRDRIGLARILQWRELIEEQHLILVYSIDGQEYLWLPTFTKHQYMTKRFPSKLPPPPQQVIDRLLTHTQQGDDVLHGDGGGDGIGIEVGTEVEDEVGAGVEKVTAPADNDTNLAMLIKTYEEGSGQVVTPYAAARLDELMEKYNPDWIADAIKEAVDTRARWPGWKYLERILERWHEQGKDARRDPGSSTKAPARPGKPPTSEESEEVRVRREVSIEKAKDDGTDYATIWQGLLAHLKKQVTKSNYEAWLEDTALLAIDGKLFVVGVPSMNSKQYLNERLKGLICKGLREALNVEDPDIDFHVGVEP